MDDSVRRSAVEHKSQGTAAGMEALPRRTQVVFRVMHARPYASRALLARLLPHHVDDSVSKHIIAYEHRNRHPVLHVLKTAMIAIAKYALIVLALVIVPFAVMWLIGNRLGHPTAGVLAALGFATCFTLAAIYSFATLWLVESAAHRNTGRRPIEAWCTLALSPLMYATSAPRFTRFEAANLTGIPELLDWLIYYGLLLINLLSFGALEAFTGELAVVQPASLSAALYTFWIHSLMLAGVIAIAVNAVRNRFDLVRDVTCLQHELTSTLKSLGYSSANPAMVWPVAYITPLPEVQAWTQVDPMRTKFASTAVLLDGTLVVSPKLEGQARAGRRLSFVYLLLGGLAFGWALALSVTWLLVSLAVLGLPVLLAFAAWPGISGWTAIAAGVSAGMLGLLLTFWWLARTPEKRQQSEGEPYFAHKVYQRIDRLPYWAKPLPWLWARITYFTLEWLLKKPLKAVDQLDKRKSSGSTTPGSCSGGGTRNPAAKRSNS